MIRATDRAVVAHVCACRDRASKGGHLPSTRNPPNPWPTAPTCADARCLPPASGPPRPRSVGDARGNSRQFRHSLFCVSELPGAET